MTFSGISSAAPLSTGECPKLLHHVFPGDSEMARRMRALDWSAADLGDPRQWPETRRTAMRLCLTSRIPVVMYWGSSYTVLYNDPYISFLGEAKHPKSLARPGQEVWAEIWDTIGPMLRSVYESGQATWSEDVRMSFARRLPLEEVFVRFTFGPLLASDGSTVDGVFCPCTETTEQVVGARRLETLRRLGLRAIEAKTVEAACLNAVDALADNPDDIPFAALYEGREGGTVQLCAAAHLDPESCALPRRIARDERLPSPWPLQQALDSLQAAAANHLPGPLSGGPWPEGARGAMVLPIMGPAGFAGLLVAGLSPRCVLDHNYRTFLDLVAGQIGVALATARAAEEERRRAEALAELDRAKTQFFSNVSHEFRTPLTLQLGAVENVLKHRTRLDPDHARELEVAQRNGLRLLKLVNTLLDFSRIEVGRMRATFEPVDLATLTSDLASNFRSACDKAGLTLDINCRPLDEPIWVDRDLWEKIVLNLISNAFKFTLQGGVGVALARRGDQVELSVADTGTGMAVHELPHIFERFHRIEDARGRSHEGSGIGLALVEELVKLHSGAIVVESELGKGSTFRVRLPRGSAHLPADRIGSGSSYTGPSLRAAAWLEEVMSWLPDASPAELDGPPSTDARVIARADPQFRVLIADDNADMRAYLVRLLSPYWRVEAVSDGQKALARARATPPDLILSDVMMPNLDGFGLLRAVRADANLRVLPVVLLSARAGEEAHAEGLEAGADDYLVKPFTARELIVRIGSALNMACVRREAGETVLARTRELEAVLDTVPAGVWFTSTSDVSRTSSNRRGAEMLGLLPGTNVSLSADGRRPYRVVQNGTELATDRLPLQRAVRGERLIDEEFEVVLPTGIRRWLLASAAALRDCDGRITGAVAAAVDISERKRLEERQRLLLNELAHRGKNLLAVIQSIALRTLADGANMTEARPAFVERLQSLSRSYQALTLGNFEGAPISTILAGELGAFAAKAEINGPDIALNDKAAQTFALVLHELATNASKHGAWSTPGGKVVIRWSVDQATTAPRLAFSWCEEGGPPARPPERVGFGTMLMRQVVAMEFGAEPSLSYAGMGFRYVFSAPLAKLQVQLREAPS